MNDMTRVHGPDHEDTLLARMYVAHFTAPASRPEEALPLHDASVAACERALGPGLAVTVRARQDLAYCTALSGNTTEAVRLYDTLLPDMARALGPDHPEVVRAKHARDDFALGAHTEAPTVR